MEIRRGKTLTSVTLIASLLMNACNMQNTIIAQESYPGVKPTKTIGVEGEIKGGTFKDVMEVFPAYAETPLNTRSFTSGETSVDIYDFYPGGVNMDQVQMLHLVLTGGLLQGRSVVTEFDGLDWNITLSDVPTPNHDLFIVPEGAPKPSDTTPFYEDTRAVSWNLDGRNPLRSIVEVTPPRQNDLLKTVNANLTYNIATEMIHGTMEASAALHDPGITLIRNANQHKAQEAAAMTWAFAMAMKSQGLTYYDFSRNYFGLTTTVPQFEGIEAFTFTLKNMKQEDYDMLPTLPLLP